MPKGPRGEKRPGDVIQSAIMVMQIATGEREEILEPRESRFRDSDRKRPGSARRQTAGNDA